MVIQRLPEYKFALAHVKPEEVLDVGCCESVLSLLLASTGLKVIGMDINPYPFPSGPNFTFMQEDVRQTTLPNKSFDTVIAISTVEHIGLDAYKNTKFEEHGDLTAMKQMNRVLKDDGVLILTVPYGYGSESWWRSYNKDSLPLLTEGLNVQVRTFVKGPLWNEVSEAEAEQTKHGRLSTRPQGRVEVCTVLICATKKL